MALLPVAQCPRRMVGACGSGSSPSLSRPMSTAWRTACSGWPSISCCPGASASGRRAPASRGQPAGPDDGQPAGDPCTLPGASGSVGAVARVPDVPARPRVPGHPARWLPEHRAELVHLASPFFLGARAAGRARRLRLPMVAVYQTDVPGYARAYRLGPPAEAAAWRWVRDIHNAADRTLAPSTAAPSGCVRTACSASGCGAAAWTASVQPGARSESLRRALAPTARVLVGYVGRLAHGEASRPAGRRWPGCRGCAWSSWAAAPPSAAAPG